MYHRPQVPLAMSCHCLVPRVGTRALEEISQCGAPPSAFSFPLPACAAAWISPHFLLAVDRSYRELADCTWHMAEKLGCFWPNAEVDRFFLAVHGHYFRACPISGRAVRDPPGSVLYPFIVVPITVTLLVTALVVWQSKHTEGIV
nr:receptor activity-modifying protein 1 isoform X2 [Macaca nemestrina]